MIPRVARPSAIIAVLGTTQTLAWASSYYLPAILAAPMAAAVGLSPSAVFGAFSVALLLTAFLGPVIGRAVDQRGGRGVLLLSNVVLAAGLVLLAIAPGLPLLLAGWAVVGLGMALGLYDSAFATLVRLRGPEAKAAITGITLIAGFASTVGWPITAALEASFGWRGACLGWAGLHLLLGLPLHLLLPDPPAAAAPTGGATEAADTPARPLLMVLLAIALAGAGANASAMGAHLPGILALAGATPAAAVLAASLIGPAQVAARVVEASLLRRAHPITSAALAVAAGPAGAALLALGAAPAAFALLHGAGNGLLTIVRATLPLALFGPNGFGARQGLVLLPVRLLQAASPFLFGIVLERAGLGVLWLYAALGVASAVALAALWRAHRRG